MYLLALAACMFLHTVASGQNNTMYLKIKGSKQGEIKGEVTEKGKEGSMRVNAYQHEISSPRDAASGQATGRRQHKPLVITKELDKASPLLYKALTTNEVLPEVTLLFYRNANTGKQDQYFTIALTDGTISGIKSWTDDKGVPMEEVSFTYQKIVWTYTNGGITHEDTWGGGKN